MSGEEPPQTPRPITQSYRRTQFIGAQRDLGAVSEDGEEEEAEVNVKVEVTTPPRPPEGKFFTSDPRKAIFGDFVTKKC